MVSSSKVSSAATAFRLSSRLQGLDKPTVWHEFSPLSVKHQSVNLGQGFPDWNPPQFAIDALATSTQPDKGRNSNQYARSYAHMPLARVLAEDYGKRFEREIDPATMIATAVGCTNALYCALHGLLSPGDEAILLEPAFDVYVSTIMPSSYLTRCSIVKAIQQVTCPSFMLTCFPPFVSIVPDFSN
jgi:kynurenine--oxoglutarate transaminase/cysteine-S-conjugate beta-lyase/glutamine--phenylpyruvate transaminase